MNEQNGYENYNEDYAYNTVMSNGKPKTRLWSVLSLVLGILSVVCCCIGWTGIVYGALSIIFAVISRNRLGYFDGMAIAGLVLAVFGMVFGITVLILPYVIPDEWLEDWMDIYFEEYESMQ